MTHDPLCPKMPNDSSERICTECYEHDCECCECELIAAVRVDMVERVANLSFYHNPTDPVEQGYNAGREIAIEVLTKAVVGGNPVISTM